MSINKEIERAIKKLESSKKDSQKQTIANIKNSIKAVKEATVNSTINFDNFKSLTITKNGKRRKVKQYTNPLSAENVLCQSIKQILDRTFKIKYPNRNKITRGLFETLLAVVQMNDFTIVKFDFKDYFNGISSIYVFEKYIKPYLLDRTEANLIQQFVNQTKYAYTGLRTSNAIAEIISIQFDKALQESFHNMGVIFYERYIDDSILILNEHVEENIINSKLASALTKVFLDKDISRHKCKTTYNQKKFRYISRRKLSTTRCSFDFLGYEFFLSLKQNKGKAKVNILFGITQSKQDKYNKRLDGIIKSYLNDNSSYSQRLELLRHRIMAFTCREVYLTKHFNSVTWRVKGFIANYGELRYLLNQSLIESKTPTYLKYAVINAFQRANQKVPYFLCKTPGENCGYNLYNNLIKNKTILLVEHIGYNHASLIKLCKQIGVKTSTPEGKPLNYNSLVRNYLIKVKVGY